MPELPDVETVCEAIKKNIKSIKDLLQAEKDGNISLTNAQKIGIKYKKTLKIFKKNFIGSRIQIQKKTVNFIFKQILNLI